MTLTRIVAASTLAGFLAAPAQAQEDKTPVARPSVTVAAFDTSRTAWMPPPSFGATVAELLTDRLVAAGTFRVIDSTLMGSPHATADASLPALRERATESGVQFLIVGAVTRLSLEQRTSSGGGIIPIPIVGGLIRKHKTESIIGLTIRVIDVQTGEVVATATSEGNASGSTSSGGGLGIVGKVPIVGAKRSSATGIKDGLLDAAVHQAVATVAEQLAAAAARLWPPRRP